MSKVQKITVLVSMVMLNFFCAEQEMAQMVDDRPVIANSSYYVCKALSNNWYSYKKYKYVFFYTFDGEFLERRSVIDYNDAKIYLDPNAPLPKPSWFSIEFHNWENHVVFYDKHRNRMASAIFIYEGVYHSKVKIDVVAQYYIRPLPKL